MCYHGNTANNDEFPEKIHFADGSHVNVTDVLLENVPYYVWSVANVGLEDDGANAKFHYASVASVDIVCVNASQDDENDGIWGAGLKVNLTTHEYFLLYVPFDLNYFEKELNYFVEEAYNGIEVVPANTDVKYQLDKMPYSCKSDVIFKCTDCNTLTLSFL